jgi:hypothetical protein
VKALIGKLGLWVRKLKGKSLDMLSHLNDFVEEKSVETKDAGIDQCIKDHLLNSWSRFSKYFPEAVCDKYKWITGPFYAAMPQNYDFSLEEANYINILPHSTLKVQLLWKLQTKFWVGNRRDLPPFSRKALNILFPFATYYL